MTSLHTIYRPKSLGEVLGQDDVVWSLQKVTADKRAHTFLFTGPSGTGKTTLARILAQIFTNNQGTIANLEELDAAKNNGVEDMRDLTTRVLYKAVGASPIKTVIIDECHKLSSGAWNTLLKPTEEPPNHVYWILCTTEPGKIPKTIQTRFLRYNLKPVKEELLMKLLKRVIKAEGLEIAPDVLEVIVEGAGGSPRQALVYLEECLYCESASEAQKKIRNAGQSKEAIDLCRFLLDKRGGWPEALKLVKGLDGSEAEGIRITIVNYLAAVLLNAQTDAKARPLLYTLECFSAEYRQSERMAPLLRSIGLALGMDQ